MMRKIATQLIFILLAVTSTALVYAQSTSLSGTVRELNSNMALQGASVQVKGKNVGATTNVDGKFSFNVSSLPVTLTVTMVGYGSAEQTITTENAKNISFQLEEQSILGQEVVVSASRTPVKILESPVSIERISSAEIKEIAAPSFYDAIANLKGVETSTQSLTFKSINTRGFNSNGNVRFNQFVDGMDNQAPGLNFAVGNVIGLSDLDVDNVELLPGASSALYGAGGINGTLLMTSLSPFKKEGVSYMLKGGVNHVDDGSRGVQPFKEGALRLAKQWNNRFGVKATVAYLEADDWRANDQRNFDRTSRQVISGDRSSDPNYDGINVYGDEITQNMRGISASVMSQTEQGILAATGNTLNIRNVLNATFPNAAPTPAQYGAFLANVPAQLRPTLQNYYPFYAGSRMGIIPNQYVSRTGYQESSLVDYNTRSFKVSGALHYKITPTVEAIAQANWGSGTSIYTGTDRYSLRNFSIGQYKLELKGSDFFLRAYTTQENAGDSYNATILGTFINEAAKPSTTWYPQYVGTYIGAKMQGASDMAANTAARSAADQGAFAPGSPQFYTAKQAIAAKPIGPQNGAAFKDKTNLYHYEGLYNLSNALNNVVDLQVGANYRTYDLNSNGTIFDDANRAIKINEYGGFAQLGKKMLDDKLKLTISGRYDKSQNFDGRFTPRASAVYTFAKNNNIRLSYQAGFRNPTTQNQYIDLTVGGGSIRLIGGLSEIIGSAKNNLYSNKAYTSESYQAFRNSSFAGAANPALLKEYTFDSKGIKPESVNAYEVGYKSLLGGKLLLDTYGYYNVYSNFITAVEVYQKNITASDATGLQNPTKFNVPVNAEGNVSTYGAALGLDYLMGKFNVNGNVSFNKIASLPTNYINDFNTPKVRYVLGFGNKAIVKNLGFNVSYRWQDQFMWNSTFATGNVPAFGTMDAQINLKIPSINTMLKIGGSNILNKYYINALGNPAVGAIYYFGLVFN